MSNGSALLGKCIAPFLDASNFGTEGGLIEGRFCAQISLLPGDPTCCLPCPATQWIYSEDFDKTNTIAEWLNVVGLVLLLFMLISYAVLPSQKTRSHYLSVCLIVAVGMICLGFTIPLAASPEQCYDEITPNDMYSSNECAWSGAFIVAGGLCAGSWIFIRALSMNLQICWDIVPGKKFFYGSQLLGWGIPAALFTATISATGVSFRFGNACHVNHENSMADFWGPLMGLTGLAAILQLVTFGYCIHVYLKNLWTEAAEGSSNGSGSGLPSYAASVRAQTARAVWRRLKKVLWLQWRGICIVSIILVDVVFFSIVFVYLDGLQVELLRDWQKVEPWLLCLITHPEDKDQCTKLAQGWLVSEPTVTAVLILLSLAGVQVFLFLTRPSIFPAWAEFIRARFSSRQEFISLDAQRPEVTRTTSKQALLRLERGHQTTTFEMQKPSSSTFSSSTFSTPILGGGPRILSLDLDTKSPLNSPSHTILSSPDEVYRSPLHNPQTASPAIEESRFGSFPPAQQQPLSPQNSDYFTANTTIPAPPATRGHQTSSSLERQYHAPTYSFSAPKTPSRQSSLRSMTYDPREIHTRGGLGLNPPSEAGESREDLGQEVMEQKGRL